MSVKLTRAQAAQLAKIKAAGDKGLVVGQMDQTTRILHSRGFIHLRDNRIATVTPEGRRF